MFGTYNGYQHDDNEIWLTVEKRAVFTPRGRRERDVTRITINGVLINNTSEAALTQDMENLETAYSVNGGDFVFYGNSGAATRHSLYSAGTINGVQVLRFDWLPGNKGIWGSGTEYVNKRSYRIILFAETLNSNSNLYLYRSTLSATGTTGPRKLWMPSLTGFPQQQITQAFTTQKIVQSGLTVGLTGWELPDPPFWGPDVEHLDRRQSFKMSPQEIGLNVSLKYPYRWAYFFESPVMIVAV